MKDKNTVEKLIQEFNDDISELNNHGKNASSEPVVIVYNVHGKKINVVLSVDDLYYISLENEEEVCVNDCIDEDDCICGNYYPNSLCFMHPIEVARFIVLNYLNGHEAFENVI